jgi:hypothetical protein
MRYCRDHPYRPPLSMSIEYRGRTYTRTELARLLAPRLNRGVGYIVQLLRENRNDVAKILATYPRYTTLSDLQALAQKYHPRRENGSRPGSTSEPERRLEDV